MPFIVADTSHLVSRSLGLQGFMESAARRLESAGEI